MIPHIKVKILSLILPAQDSLGVALRSVHTDDPPLAVDGHVFNEIFPFQCHVTIRVRTENILKRARCQVNLL